MRYISLLLFALFGLISITAQTVTVSELNYNDEGTLNSGDWLEIWNYGNSAVDISGFEIKDGIAINSYFIPAGTTLAANGRKVIARDPAVFAAVYPTVTGVLGPMSFGFDNITDQVNLRNAFGQSLASFVYIDSLPWPRGADGSGRTLELLNHLNPLTNPANWFDGCLGGSPGAAYTPCNDPIVFSEIMYNSSLDLPCENWIELRNTTNTAKNISNWVFRDRIDTTTGFIIPANTIIPAGGNLVLAQNYSSFHAIYPTITNVIGSFVFNFDNNGEILRLFDNNGLIKQSVIYDDLPEYGWPTPPDGLGYTLELEDPHGKMNDGNNWFSGCFGGSPGTAYNANCCLSPLLPATINVTGSANGCADGAVYTYNAPASPYLTYNWTLVPAGSGTILSGQGTATITVDWNSTGTVQVTVNMP